MGDKVVKSGLRGETEARKSNSRMMLLLVGRDGGGGVDGAGAQAPSPAGRTLSPTPSLLQPPPSPPTWAPAADPAAQTRLVTGLFPWAALVYCFFFFFFPTKNFIKGQEGRALRPADCIMLDRERRATAGKMEKFPKVTLDLSSQNRGHS